MGKEKYKYRKTFTYEGIKYEVYGHTLDEVYEKKQKKIAALEKGQIVYSGNMTVREWTEQALKTYKINVNDDTLEAMTLRINKHILSAIGSRPLKSVTAIQCQQILNAQVGMSYSHITKLYQEIQFIFSTALKNRLIPYDPTEDLVKPDGVKGHRRSITKKERHHLLSVCAERKEFILFELMLYCGCRPGEAIEIMGKDVSTIAGQSMLHIRGTKTENSDRHVPVPAILLPRLKDVAPFDYVACNSSGRRHSESSYDRLVKALKRAMNISMGCKVYRNALIPPLPLADDFVPYDLRHTYCTDLARAGVDIRTAQKLMGHANISVTADIYTHVDTDDIVGVAGQIDRYLNAI